MSNKRIRLLISLFLANGTTSLIMSLYINSSLLALIGLGLLFWGAVLLYIEPKENMIVNILNSSSSSLLTIINQITSAFNYRGQVVYLPPQYSNEERVFINWGTERVIPQLRDLRHDSILTDLPLGLSVSPPGLGLANLYEQEMGIRFIDVDINYIKQYLPQLITEHLGIAENVNIEVLDDIISVSFTNHIFKDLCSSTSVKDCRSLCCPLCSSIALVITRASDRPVTIEQLHITNHANNLKILFRMN